MDIILDPKTQKKISVATGTTIKGIDKFIQYFSVNKLLQFKHQVNLNIKNVGWVPITVMQILAEMDLLNIESK